MAALLLLATGPEAGASVPIEMSIEELACRTDHVLMARVVDVELINSKGHVQKSGDTGPGLGNTIRLILEVDEVVESNAAEVPQRLKFPLDSFMHYSVEQVRRVHHSDSAEYLVLLVGDRFQPFIPGLGLLSASLREKVTSLRASCKRPKP
jgi:hypothetical protein